MPDLNTIAALRVAYNRKTTLSFNRDAVTLPLFDRSYQDDIRAYGETKIPNPNYNATIQRRTAPDIDFDAPATASVEYLAHALEAQAFEGSVVVDYRAAPRLPYNAMDMAREKAAREVKEDIEEAVWTKIRAATLTTIAQGTAGSFFIKPDGDPSGVGSEKLPRLAMNKFITAMIRAKILGQSALDPIGGALGMPWCVLPPEIYSVFTDQLIDAGYQYDRLTEDILSRGAVMTNEAETGVYRRIMLVNTPVLPVATSGTQKWEMYLGFAPAIAYSETEPLIRDFVPTNHPTKPVSQMNLIVDIAVTIKQTALLRKVTIEQK